MTEELTKAVASMTVQSPEESESAECSMVPALFCLTKSANFSYVWSETKKSFIYIKNHFNSVPPRGRLDRLVHADLLSVECIALSVVEDQVYLFKKCPDALEVCRANLKNGVLTGEWKKVGSLYADDSLCNSVQSVVLHKDAIAIVAFSAMFLFNPSRNKLKKTVSFHELPILPCVFLLNSTEVCILGGTTSYGSDTRKMLVWQQSDGAVKRLSDVLPPHSQTAGMMSATLNNQVFLTMEDCIATISSTYTVSRIVDVDDDRRFGSMVPLNDKILIIGRKLPSAWQFDPASGTMLQDIEVKSVNGFYWVLNLPKDELDMLEPKKEEEEEEESDSDESQPEEIDDRQLALLRIALGLDTYDDYDDDEWGQLRKDDGLVYGYDVYAKKCGWIDPGTGTAPYDDDYYDDGNNYY